MHIDQFFLSWLCEFSTNNFQQSFIVDEVPDIQSDIAIESQKCINSTEDTSSMSSEIVNIAINIAGIVLQQTDR